MQKDYEKKKLKLLHQQTNSIEKWEKLTQTLMIVTVYLAQDLLLEFLTKEKPSLNMSVKLVFTKPDVIQLI
jgi:hypothetical protein